MDIFQQRIAALNKSRARLLVQLGELEQLRERVRKAERLGTRASTSPLKSPAICVDRGPLVLSSQKTWTENSNIPLHSIDGD
jgi:sensor domain CHASE-containing protein